MQTESRTMVFDPGLTARTANGNSGDIVTPQGFASAFILLNVTAVSGTLPTLDLYIQRRIRDAASADLVGNDSTGTLTYDDFLHFTQVTATGKRTAGVGINNTNFEAVLQDAAIGAATFKGGPLGDCWRVKWVVGGTTPSFKFSLVVQFLPLG